MKNKDDYGDASKRCAIYTRTATTARMKGKLESQRVACEAYIDSHAARGWRARPERYDDEGYSGNNSERPGFQRLWEDIDEGEVDVVIVSGLDRISRNLNDVLATVDLLEQKDVGLVVISQNIATNDDSGRLALQEIRRLAGLEHEVMTFDEAKRRERWRGNTQKNS